MSVAFTRTTSTHYDNTPPAVPYGLTIPYQEYLILQDMETYDANVRLTLRPWKNVTAISRYEFQLSTIGTAPDPLVGISDTETSRMTSHVIAQDISWIPWSRLSLQGGLNYVLSETRTPASDVVQGILEAQNNYWTVHFSSVVALDNKTDLALSYLYYLSGDYSNNSPLGVPYGAGSEENAVTATLTRRISKNLRLAVEVRLLSLRQRSLRREPGFWGERHHCQLALPVLNGYAKTVIHNAKNERQNTIDVER